MIKPTQQAEQGHGEEKEESAFSSVKAFKKNWGEKLARNMALSGMLVLTLTAVRNAKLPSGETVLTAVKQLVDAGWDEQVGKISFVSTLLPESVAVFFQTEPQGDYLAPCFGALQHAWTEQEPYLGYLAPDDRVYAIAPGQVMSLSHGEDEKKVLRIRQEDGLETLYYNLAASAVQEGDRVTASTCLGTALPQGVMIEVRQAGRAIDPTSSLSPRGEDAL